MHYLQQRLGKILTSGLLAGLALLHVQLLWQRIESFTLLEPLVALRWSAAALVLAGFIRLQRAGISIVRGRRARILWLVLLVLHAGALSTSAPLPLVEPGTLLVLSLWGAALLASGRLACRIRAPRLAWRPRIRHRFGVPAEAGSYAPLSPRPPPLGLAS